jgi:hypothetical protein
LKGALHYISKSDAPSRPTNIIHGIDVKPRAHNALFNLGTLAPRSRVETNVVIGAPFAAAPSFEHHRSS